MITNDINNKKYIGKTNFSIEKRFKEHVEASVRETTEKRPLYRAINKYGIEHFNIKLLEECSYENASEREIYWINRLKTYGNNGYNATYGGDGKQLYDYQEIVIKYLEFKNIVKTALFFHCDKATVKKACEEYGIVIIPSNEINKKEYGKKVAQCDKNDHSIIYHLFNSLTEASYYLINNNLSKCKKDTIRTHISEVCRGKRKSAAGFYWTFI